MMFLDEYYYTTSQWHSGYYSYGYYHNGYYTYNTHYYPNPEAGIMPLFGFVFLLISTILLSSAYKKNPNTGIASIILTLISSLLLETAIVLACGRMGYIGGFCSIAAGALLDIVFVLEIIFVVLANVSKKKEQNTITQQSNPIISAENKKLIDINNSVIELEGISDLFVSGILDAEECKKEKDRIISKYFNSLNNDVAPIAQPKIDIDGVYYDESKNTKITLYESHFTIEMGGKLIKEGDFTIQDSNVKLQFDQGKIMSLSIKDGALTSITGVQYSK